MVLAPVAEGVFVGLLLSACSATIGRAYTSLEVGTTEAGWRGRLWELHTLKVEISFGQDGPLTSRLVCCQTRASHATTQIPLRVQLAGDQTQHTR